MKKTLLINEIEVVITDDQSLLPGSSIDRQSRTIDERISCDGTHMAFHNRNGLNIVEIKAPKDYKE